MALESAAPRSRRAVLAAVVGGLGGYLASVLGRPDSARAAVGDAVILGANNSGAGLTSVTNTLGGTTFVGYSTGDGAGINGQSATGYGVWGTANAMTGSGVGVVGSTRGPTGTGVVGFASSTSGATRGVRGSVKSPDGTGVQGYCGTGSLPVPAPKTGVYGYSDIDSAAVGVRGHSPAGDGIVGSSAGAAKSGIWGNNTGGGYGVAGSSSGAAAAGVWGSNSAGTGVRGTSVSQSGVLGFGGSGAAPAGPASTGVYGFAAAVASSRGVFGKTTIGAGVRGEATSGVGLQGVATTGLALAVSGRATFSRSGRASVPINASYVDVTVPGGLSSSANVLATLQSYRAGVYVAAVRTNYPTSGKARIYLSKVASTSATTPVAWFVLG